MTRENCGNRGTVTVGERGMKAREDDMKVCEGGMRVGDLQEWSTHRASLLG